MKHNDIQKFREQALKTLSKGIGVYALCDANETVRYIGKTVDSIRARVQRHITSARSDIIANRLVDPNEIAFVLAFECVSKDDITPLETHLIHHYNMIQPLMNGKIPKPLTYNVIVPPMEKMQIVSDEQLHEMQTPSRLLTSQIKLVSDLSDYIIGVKDNHEMRRSLLGAGAVLDDLIKRFCASYDEVIPSSSNSP